MSAGNWGLYTLNFDANQSFSGTTTPFVFQWWSGSSGSGLTIDTVNNRFVITQAGPYLIKYDMSFVTSIGVPLNFAIYVNGVQQSNTLSNSGVNTPLTGSTMLNLNINDTIDLRFLTQSGPPSPISTAVAHAGSFYITSTATSNAQSVPTAFYVSVNSLATAPSQLQMSPGSNFVFDGNIYVLANTSGGCKVALQAPSGVYAIMQSQGPTGYDAMLQTGISAGSYGTQIGTGIYAGTVGAVEAIAIAGSIRSAPGCTGPVFMSILPVTSGYTMTIMPGSNIVITSSL
jgi:hypothetical protein